MDLQQKSGLRYLVLENKISAMRDELDVKDAQLHEVISSSEDDTKNKGLLSRTRNVVEGQEKRIKALEREIVMMRQRSQWGDHEEAATDKGEISSLSSGETSSSSSGSTSASSKMMEERKRKYALPPLSKAGRKSSGSSHS